MKPSKSGSLDLFNPYDVMGVSSYTGFPQIGVILLKIKESSLRNEKLNHPFYHSFFDKMYLELGCSVSNLSAVNTRLNTKRMFTLLVNYLDCATVVDESWVSIAIIAKNCFRRFNNEDGANHE